MKALRIAGAIGQIDGDLICAAAESNRRAGHRSRLKWGAVAACLAGLILAGAMLLPSLSGGKNEPASRYRDVQIRAGERMPEWQWAYKTVYEKYTRLTLDGAEYQSRCRAVSANLVEERIGTYPVAGYDSAAGREYTETFEVYGLKDADRSRYVAVKMDGAYYTFMKNACDPPRTLGNLLALVNLPGTVELKRFSENGDGPERRYFSLDSDDSVWEILAGCGDAAFVADDRWTVSGRTYLSFSVTSEVLGVYHAALYVTADGYLWTNAFDYQYLFRIGEEAAGKILRYAKEHSARAAFEPYQNTLVGTVTAITDEYILIDDSVLCRNPADGITYRIPLTDPRISRYAECRVIREGEVVQITYEGEIDRANGNTVDRAVSIDEVILSGSDVLIPD